MCEFVLLMLKFAIAIDDEKWQMKIITIPKVSLGCQNVTWVTIQYSTLVQLSFCFVLFNMISHTLGVRLFTSIIDVKEY